MMSITASETTCLTKHKATNSWGSQTRSNQRITFSRYPNRSLSYSRYWLPRSEFSTRASSTSSCGPTLIRFCGLANELPALLESLAPIFFTMLTCRIFLVLVCGLVEEWLIGTFIMPLGHFALDFLLLISVARSWDQLLLLFQRLYVEHSIFCSAYRFFILKTFWRIPNNVSQNETTVFFFVFVFSPKDITSANRWFIFRIKMWILRMKIISP